MLVHYDILTAPVKDGDDLVFTVKPTEHPGTPPSDARLRSNYTVVRKDVTRVESRHAECEGLRGTATAIYRHELTSSVIGTLALFIPTTG